MKYLSLQNKNIAKELDDAKDKNEILTERIDEVERELYMQRTKTEIYKHGFDPDF